MRELFVAEPDELLPPQPPGYVAHVVALGRRSARRRLAMLSTLWTIIGLALLTVAVPGLPPDWQPTRPAAPADAPSLPDRFAGYSVLTSTVSGDPAGRAIALYGYGNGELFTMFQPLVVGADRDTYRRVDAVEKRGLPSALLSPDGTKVLVGDDRGATDSLVLVDLVTGRERHLRVEPKSGVRLLAWSPDGRYVAYSAAPVAGSGLERSNGVDAEVSKNGVLVLLDVAAGTSTRIPSLQPVWSAAFAPDSVRLAVQVGMLVHIINPTGPEARTGRETSTVAVPDGMELVGNVAWSPDGMLLAMQARLPANATGHDQFTGPDRAITFVDALNAGYRVPPPIAGYDLLGWRSPSSVLIMTVEDSWASGKIVEVSFDGGRRSLTHFDQERTCELYTQPCQVFNVRLATALIPELTVREAGFPRRGTWPVWLVATILMLAAGVAALIVRYRRRRRARRR